MLERHLTYRLVLQLDRVGVLNRHVLDQLLHLRQQIDARGGIMRLCSLSPSNWRALRTCDPDQVFLPYRTREEAVMGAYRPHQPK